MRWIVLFAVACGSHLGGGSVDAVSDPATCKSNLEAAIDRSCSVASDCVLVGITDCCGTVKIAIKKGTEASFPAIATTYDACLACGGRGCFHADVAEDGGAPQAGQSIVAACTAQGCRATVQ